MNLIELISNQTKVLHIAPALRQKFLKMMREQPVILVALCGETASGKTTLTNALKTHIPTVSVISADNYFCDISEQMRTFGSFSKLVESGYDTDSADNFQMAVLRHDLQTLKANQKISMPHYEMRDGSSTPKAIPFTPSKIVCVEGICTLYPHVRDLFDIKVYLSVDKKIQWARYQKRATERGQNPAQIRTQFELVSRAAEKYIIPNKAYADLVVESYPMSPQKIASRKCVMPPIERVNG